MFLVGPQKGLKIDFKNIVNWSVEFCNGQGAISLINPPNFRINKTLSSNQFHHRIIVVFGVCVSLSLPWDVWLCLLQVRAASTVTSWSNQTPTALPTAPPPPLQVGITSDPKVHQPSSRTRPASELILKCCFWLLDTGLTQRLPNILLSVVFCLLWPTCPAATH